MPIFHDNQEGPPSHSPSPLVSRDSHVRVDTMGLPRGRLSTDSMQDLGPTSPTETRQKCYDSLRTGPIPSRSERIELIERLKRSISPPSLQKQQLEAGFSITTSSFRPISACQSTSPHGPSTVRPSSPPTLDLPRDLEKVGLEIERPRSALHSGDFREKQTAIASEEGSSSSTFLATSPVVPWNEFFPNAHHLPCRQGGAPSSFERGSTIRSRSRLRAISQSSFGSFTFLPPTSPLVQQASHADHEPPSSSNTRPAMRSLDMANRRHTYSASLSQDYQASQMARSVSGTASTYSPISRTMFPCQAHQPKRAATYHPCPFKLTPQTLFAGSRKPSLTTDTSPLQHAPMVGSYEESILRGRMSTTPSRPLDFVAKIGVLGTGQCKSSLRCPPHVTVPFPAVFYSYETGNGRISDNEPSPYVGLVDLENSLPPSEDNDDLHKQKRRHTGLGPGQTESNHILQFTDGIKRVATDSLRRKEKKKRRSASPRAPPGGSYRIPAQGQLQIVIKNPNKTAVKLFLVPYDVSDMDSGQKTFIRQRSYSAEPIIDMPASSRIHLGTKRSEAALSNSDVPNDRPKLRYLIHLHICCPSKGKYYLHRSIRVVFANRVPDGKEKMRNEIQLPEPRYSAYKPFRDFTTMPNAISIASQFTSEQALRRHSASFTLSRSQHALDKIDGLRQCPALPPPAIQFTGGSFSPRTSGGFSSPMSDIRPIPFSLSRLAAAESRPESRECMEVDSNNNSNIHTLSYGYGEDSSIGTFEKLTRSEAGYGINSLLRLNAPDAVPSAGLLSQKLRGLDVQQEPHLE